MKNRENLQKEIDKQRMLIFGMIDASIELARKRGIHPLENDCSCVSCVNKRKSLLFKNDCEFRL